MRVSAKQKTGSKTKQRKAIILLLVVVLLGVVVSIVLLRPTTKNTDVKTIPETSNKTNSSTKSTSSATSDTQPKSTDSVKESSASQTNTSSALIPPFGSFVSNHYPGQNGSDNKELSQCNTSPGASCYIKFTQGATIRTLPVKTADQSGSIYWEWNIADANLTSGKWTIEAVATLGNKTETTTDQIKLEVQ